jgi:hypothetical protein
VFDPHRVERRDVYREICSNITLLINAVWMGFSCAIFFHSPIVSAAISGTLPVSIQIDGFSGNGTLSFDLLGFELNGNGSLDDVNEDGLFTTEDLADSLYVRFTHLEHGDFGYSSEGGITPDYPLSDSFGMSFSQTSPSIEGPLSDFYFD